jgi:minor extracellular protease Epr
MLTDSMLPAWDTQLLNREEFKILGVTKWHAAGYRGEGVKIAVLDNRLDVGVEFLKGRVRQPLSHNTGLGEYSITVPDSHGQRVCQVIVDVAPMAEVFLLPYFNQGELNSIGTLDSSIQWCIDNGVNIINASIIGSGRENISRLSDICLENGMSLFCASGNESVTAISGLPQWLGIGRVDLEDGDLVKYGVPTENIFCVSIGRFLFPRILQDGAALSAGGTSYSCPAVAASIALVYQRYKERTGSFPDQDYVMDLMMRNMQNPEGWDLPSEDFGQGLFVLPSPFSVGAI